MSDWSEDYSNTNLTTAPAEFDFDAFMAGIVGSLPPDQQQAANDLGAAEIAGYFGGGNGKVIGSVQGGAAPDVNEKSAISKWWGGLTSDDKKLGLSVAALLGGGLANIGTGKRKDRELNIAQQNADTNAAGVAERARQFNQQMANGSAIGQTNFGTATQPLGMINAPVTLTRNRLKPTPGVPQ